MGRNINFSAFYGSTHPDFRIDTGFVRRVDDKRMNTNLAYRWWPEHWLVNWGPRVSYGRDYSFEGVLLDETAGGGLDFTFARNVRLGLSAERALERYGDVDFWKWNQGVDFDVNTSRRVALVGNFSWGEAIRYGGMPFLGRARLGSLTAIFRPISRLQSQMNVELSRLEDPRAETLVFDIRVLRALTTFYLGYDGHYQQEDRLDRRRARIAGADLRRHRLQHHRKAEARRHQARAPTTIHPAVAGRFTAPRVVTSSPSAAGSALGYRTPQTSTDGRSLRLVSCCSEPGKPDPHRSVATAAATAPSP